MEDFLSTLRKAVLRTETDRESQNIPIILLVVAYNGRLRIGNWRLDDKNVRSDLLKWFNNISLIRTIFSGQKITPCITFTYQYLLEVISDE